MPRTVPSSRTRAHGTISLFDFGYGTGRVTNEFVGSHVNRYSKLGKDLRVVAYDVSCAGLMKAKEVLRSKGFTPDGPIAWKPEETAGYIAGRVSKRKACVNDHGCLRPWK